jgi:hypothetical protein
MARIRKSINYATSRTPDWDGSELFVAIIRELGVIRGSIACLILCSPFVFFVVTDLSR